MINYRNNSKPIHAGADAAFEAMRRHAGLSDPPKPPVPVAGSGRPSYAPEDFERTGKRIALRLFGCDSEPARRSAYRLAEHYLKRGIQAGFFKDNGTLCLCVPVYLKYHGLV
jgi:hypothetical protein